jgi:hypothetical protein
LTAHRSLILNRTQTPAALISLPPSRTNQKRAHLNLGKFKEQELSPVHLRLVKLRRKNAPRTGLGPEKSCEKERVSPAGTAKRLYLLYQQEKIPSAQIGEEQPGKAGVRIILDLITCFSNGGGIWGFPLACPGSTLRTNGSTLFLICAC